MEKKLNTSEESTSTPQTFSTYMGIECYTWEQAPKVIQDVMKACSERKVFFRDTVTLGFHPMGSKRALRVKVDIDPEKMPRFQEAVLEGTGRRVVYFDKQKQEFKNPAWGSIPVSAMLAIPNPAYYAVYKGTKIKGWERQFPATNSTPTSIKEGLTACLMRNSSK